MKLIEAERVSKSFGGTLALCKVSSYIEEGEILGLIGPNGAGKTTLLNTIAGLLKPTGGDIFWKGKRITGLSRDATARLGIIKTFQITRVFQELTVFESILLGVRSKTHPGIFNFLFPKLRSGLNPGKTEHELALEELRFWGLEAYRNAPCKNLPFGITRRVGIAVAMAAGPEVLLLDEPATGMNPEEKRSLAELMNKTREKGTTIWLIDHDMGFLMGVVDRVEVLSCGVKIAEGSPDEIQCNEEVIRVYLGDTEATSSGTSIF